MSDLYLNQIKKCVLELAGALILSSAHIGCYLLAQFWAITFAVVDRRDDLIYYNNVQFFGCALLLGTIRWLVFVFYLCPSQISFEERNAAFIRCNRLSMLTVLVWMFVLFSSSRGNWQGAFSGDGFVFIELPVIAIFSLTIPGIWWRTHQELKLLRAKAQGLS